MAAIIIRIFSTPPIAPTCLNHGLSPYYHDIVSDPRNITQNKNQPTYLRSRHKVPRRDLGEDEQADEPAPREEAEREVVPERDEREDEHGRVHEVARAAERDVDVAHDPKVV